MEPFTDQNNSSSSSSQNLVSVVFLLEFIQGLICDNLVNDFKTSRVSANCLTCLEGEGEA